MGRDSCDQDARLRKTSVSDTMVSAKHREEANYTLSQLVSHFNQPIHSVAEVPPYFLGNGKPIIDNPVLQFCLERLRQLPAGTVSAWIVGYGASVHDALFIAEEESFPIPVVQAYEIMLWAYRVRLQVEEAVFDEETVGSIAHIAALVSKDIRVASRATQKYSTYLRCNVLIPTLIRVLNHLLLILHTGPFSIDEDNQRSCVDIYVSLLPFTQPLISPGSILPTLVAKRSLDDFCAFPPKEMPVNGLLSVETVDWGELTLDGTDIFYARQTDTFEWTTKEISKNLSLLLSLSSSGHSSCDVAENAHFVDTKQVAKAAQARFFGHDQEDMMKLRTESIVMLGSRIERSVKPLGDKEFKENPSVIHALVNFIVSLKDAERGSTSELVSCLVPCCLELINSTNDMHSALGLAALAHLLLVLDSNHVAWKEVRDDILSRLEDAVRCHRHGVILLVIGHTQQIVLQKLCVGGEVCARLCRQWMVNLHQAANRSVSEHCWELLVGGIIPCLLHLVVFPDARGMELGRLGLSVLLPILSGRSVPTRTQFAATIALINLMLSAHPMMNHHGGKIQCHLLSPFSKRPTVESSDVEALRRLTVHTAAVCVLVCGRSAQAVIDAIEADEEKYQRSFSEIISEVKMLVLLYRANYGN